MKVSLEFDLSEEAEQEQLGRCTNADNAYRCLEDIAQQIFRPARKHGYSDTETNEAYKSGNTKELMRLLERDFYLLIEKYGVKF